MKLKKGDEVKIIAGGNKGRTGTILETKASQHKVRVKGVHIQTHYNKKKPGFTKQEGFIDWSNVKLLKASPTKSKKKSLK